MFVVMHRLTHDEMGHQMNGFRFEVPDHLNCSRCVGPGAVAVRKQVLGLFDGPGTEAAFFDLGLQILSRFQKH